MDEWTHDDEILTSFQAEAEERLQNLNDGLLRLEKNPDDTAVVEAIFRDAHTLKGSAGMMGLADTKELAHSIEDVLGDVKEKRLGLSTAVFNCLFKALDAITELIESVVQGQEAEIDTRIINDRLAALRKGPSESSLSAEEPPEPDRVAESAAKEEPAEPVPEPVAEAGRAPEDSGQPESCPSPKQRNTADEFIKVSIAKLDVLLNLVGELVLNKKRLDEDLKRVSELVSTVTAVQKTMSVLKGTLQPWLAQADPAQATSLRKTSDAVGELIGELQNQGQALKDAVSLDTQTMDIVSNKLERAAMRTRMLPVSAIFTPLGRIVRDLCQTQGKDARLVIEGGETELDKKVLEQMADPLMHLVRNSIDHGIECPEEREAAGKPRMAVLKLSAYQKGDRIVIEVADDGRGIDADKVRRVAVEKGLGGEDESTADEQAIYVIFRSGFSTSKEVTDVSGRGVGLDVVRNNIEILDGNIGVETEKGRGTAFIISLPVTLALVRGLLVRVEDEIYALPLTAVEESKVVKQGDIKRVGNKEIIDHRGHSVPIARLSSIVGPGTQNGDASGTVVVLSTLYRTVGFFVRELLGEQELVVKNLGDFLSQAPNLAGATILGNGDVVLILDPNALIRKARRAAIEAPARLKQPDAEQGNGASGDEKVDAPRPEKRQILIVEDSLTVRELERNILEAAGYAVETAIDGLDALSRLSETEVDLAIVDIDMPRMDGFELTRNLRESDRFRDLPIIIVTARTSEEDKRKGIDVGANAFIVKKSFQQGELLETIRQLVGESEPIK